MPYYRKVKKKINGKWYPQSVTVGDPVTTDEIAQLLADFSSASVGDTYNILKNLARAMSIYMSNGRRPLLARVHPLGRPFGHARHRARFAEVGRMGRRHIVVVIVHHPRHGRRHGRHGFGRLLRMTLPHRHTHPEGGAEI